MDSTTSQPQSDTELVDAYEAAAQAIANQSDETNWDDLPSQHTEWREQAVAAVDAWLDAATEQPDYEAAGNLIHAELCEDRCVGWHDGKAAVDAAVVGRILVRRTE